MIITVIVIVIIVIHICKSRRLLVGSNGYADCAVRPIAIQAVRVGIERLNVALWRTEGYQPVRMVSNCAIIRQTVGGSCSCF